MSDVLGLFCSTLIMCVHYVAEVAAVAGNLSNH